MRRVERPLGLNLRVPHTSTLRVGPLVLPFSGPQFGVRRLDAALRVPHPSTLRARFFPRRATLLTHASPQPRSAGRNNLAQGGLAAP